ncbi:MULTISPECIES: MmgE/PrpD family protein [unclassified Streptomyces]|uniref:MmgE/PrpD family protein n=1 Tax=unclassified Streptomyces TaxID=2593676 RepID=UPI0033EC35CD
MTATEELSAWAAALRPDDVPEHVLDLAQSQILSQLAAIRAGLRHPLGRRLVQAYGSPLAPDPRQTACVLAALGSWLNFDDTAYAGHLSNSTVAVPVAYALSGRLDGAGLLTAVVAANECAARITAAATLGRFRGQVAVHTHLAGGIVARLHVESAPTRHWVDALGIAYTLPPWTLFPGFLGSDAKLVHALAAVRAAMDACDAAHAGLHGSPEILEHADGFLRHFATVPLAETVTQELGRRWHTETLSFKVRPGGPGIDAAVDCALDLTRTHGPLRAEDIEQVTVAASYYTVFAGRHAKPYADSPDAPLSALLLSAPYAVATALLEGDLTVEDFSAPRVRDARRWQLAQRIRLEHDPDMTRALLRSEAPFGEALRQAGAAGRTWLEQFGGERLTELLDPADEPAPSFGEATKATPAQVTVHMQDGRTYSTRRDIPVGAAGPETRRNHGPLVRGKFLTQGGSSAVADACLRLRHAPAEKTARTLRDALDDLV